MMQSMEIQNNNRQNHEELKVEDDDVDIQERADCMESIVTKKIAKRTKKIKSKSIME